MHNIMSGLTYTDHKIFFLFSNKIYCVGLLYYNFNLLRINTLIIIYPIKVFKSLVYKMKSMTAGPQIYGFPRLWFSFYYKIELFRKDPIHWGWFK